jgi:hypothetical protein
MMKVLDVHVPRGWTDAMVFVALDGPEPEIGSELRRVSDGKMWQIRGVEWHCVPNRPALGDRVGLRLQYGASVRVDDDLERVVHQGGDAA